MLETRPLFVFEIDVEAPRSVSEHRRVIELSAHYLLEREGGARVEVHSTGVRAAPPAVLAALQAGQSLPASAYYFRTHMRFTAHAEDLRRLNHVLAVSVGERRAQSVRLEIYEVL